MLTCIHTHANIKAPVSALALRASGPHTRDLSAHTQPVYTLYFLAQNSDSEHDAVAPCTAAVADYYTPVVALHIRGFAPEPGAERTPVVRFLHTPGVQHMPVVASVLLHALVGGSPVAPVVAVEQLMFVAVVLRLSL